MVSVAAYYNEIDPYAAQWLRNLIAAGHIAAGEVDERSIADVQPSDLRGFTQCHFFAGIGGWSLALRIGGWNDEIPVWTGSCPCQPFSDAGARTGTADPRHLWPEWYRLIRECRPGVIFGEQVEAAVKHGWLDLVSSDLEREGYAVGAVVLPAAGVGAPHARSRLWFVADTNRIVGDGDGIGGPERGIEPADHCAVVDGGDPGGTRLPSRERELILGEGRRGEGGTTEQHGRTFWSDAVWLQCSDGKARPTQSGLSPLADGIPNRVGKLRAYGNAIVPQVAAEVVMAYLNLDKGRGNDGTP